MQQKYLDFPIVAPLMNLNPLYGLGSLEFAPFAKGERKLTFDLYIGRRDMLGMDPTHLKWKLGDDFQS